MNFKNYSRRKRIFIFIAPLALTIFAPALFLLNRIGNWLIINERLKKVDVIIVISGDKGERLKHAVKLFHKKFTNYLLVSGCDHPNHPDSYTPAMREKAVSLGVPQANIIMDLGSNTSTGDQAINVIEILKEKKFKSAIIVTSDYHTRRTRMMFQRACQNDTIQILMSYPVINSFDHNERWKSGLRKRIVVYESIKLVWYWFFFSGKRA